MADDADTVVDDEVQAPSNELAEDVTPEAASTSEPEASGDAQKDEQPKKKGGGFQKRISELTAQLRQAQRELEAARAKPETPQADEPAPKRDQFDDYEAYLEAHTRWVARSEAQSIKQAADAEYQRRIADRERDAREGDWQAKVETFREDHPDWDAVALNPALPITAEMAETLRELDNGPEVAYHLGKNPELVDRLAGMSDRKAALELARLSERLVTQVKRTSAAPKPIEPVRSTGRANVDPLSEKLSIDEWVKNRRKQVAGVRS